MITGAVGWFRVQCHACCQFPADKAEVGKGTHLKAVVFMARGRTSLMRKYRAHLLVTPLSTFADITHNTSLRIHCGRVGLC